jgi:type III restriction enzyme
VTFGYHDFDLQGLESIARQPVSDQIMVQRLRDDARTYLARAIEGAREDRPENYLVRHLMDMPEVDYDSQNELLFKLSGQMVARASSYLSDEADVENVLLVHGKDLARFIFEQMKTHYWETPTDYRATVSRGFQLLRPQAFNVPNDRAVRPFRQPVVPAGDTRKHVFGGFQKCCYPYQRFQSNVRGPDRQQQRSRRAALDEAGSGPVPHRICQRPVIRTGLRGRDAKPEADRRNQGRERDG